MTGRITQLDHDGLTFDVADAGPLDGEPVVLLHGFPERNTSWRHVAPLLHDAGLRTYALDQRGYSPGARPRRRRDYRLGKLAGDVAALVDLVGAPVHLVGHDWGAVVGWMLAARRPELLRTWTAISVPHPRAFLKAGLTSTQGVRSWYIGFFQLPRLAELSARTTGGFFDRSLLRSGMTEEEVARFRREIVDAGALPHALGWYRAIALGDPSGTGRVAVPTTFVWSDGDTAVARTGAEETGRWIDADYELVVLEGVSHWIPTQAPEECAAAILRRVGAPGVPA
ncbi:alpha/beta fold hydrolase [Nocardioides sp.]|uniref:alpha/beta fold hydrolase n=1 Tax=Nocardioides sp. TaxID=35761 RepID=UPI0025CC4B1C|nr:alpha/beta fold hydrolase [Nocardioides sp.]